MLRAMRHVVRTVTAIRFALSTRPDLLLEVLALHHQLAVLARSTRRFRPSDRLLWLILRRVWPRWRDALVLVQPATVDRWHRDRFDQRWWRRSRRPGRPRIDSPCRVLIRRLAEENRLWGAPRIHGELLKLGLVVSERTVSRYLRERPRRPSQTWRTFLVNHLGQFTLISPVMSPHLSGDDVVDARGRDVSLNAVVRPTVCVESMPAHRLARLGPTHMCWLAYSPGSLSRPHRHAKQHQPGPAEEWMRAADSRRARCRLIRTFRTGPTAIIDRVRLLWADDSRPARPSS